ncbi:MAG: hypothetical protein ACXWTU_00420, partial [Methylotenera sp.]
YFNDPIFDIQIFALADQLIKNYEGEYWEYMLTDENVAFMRLTDDKETLVNPFSGEEIEADKLLAGMVVTSYALLYRIEKEYGSYGASDSLIDQHYALNQAIRQYCQDTQQMDVWMTIMD